MSKSDHSKIQYTKYYEHKMNLLNLLRQYRDRIIETSSFYCVVCDFITEEKYMWDKHNKTKHPDADNRCTIYCSTCSMLITCKNNEEHSGTTEHCVFMKYLQSLECVEEDIVKKTMLKDFVKNTLNGTSVIKSSKKLELNNTNSTDGNSIVNNYFKFSILLIDIFKYYVFFYYITFYSVPYIKYIKYCFLSLLLYVPL